MVNSHSARDLNGVIERVFAYYIQRLGRNPKAYTLTPKRRRQAWLRLIETLKKNGNNLEKAEALFKWVINKVAASPFHNGQSSSGMKFIEWEDHIFKSQEQFENWIEL